MVYKLVVISDIHRNTAALERILPIINSADYLVFCGDGVRDIMSYSGAITVPMVCVKGNNDFHTNITDLASVVMGETKVLVTHGHRQDVRRGIGTLLAVAKGHGCSLVFYGHTHIYADIVADGVHIINPGALCDGSYALVVGDGVNFVCKNERA